MKDDAFEPADVLRQLAGDEGGWDKVLDLSGSHAQRLNSGDYDDIASAARAAFCTPGGEKLLQWLINQTLLMATWPGDVMGGDQLTTYGPFREGQNSIVILLHRLITRADEIETGNGDSHE